MRDEKIQKLSKQKKTVEKNQTLPSSYLTKTNWTVSKLKNCPKHTVEKNTHHPHQKQMKGNEIRKIFKREKIQHFHIMEVVKKAGPLDHFYRNLF